MVPAEQPSSPAAEMRPSDPVKGVLGVVADIHGNPFALDAVVAHGHKHGVDRWLILGDVVAMGPQPGRVLEQLGRLEAVAFVAGNTERYVLSGDRPEPSLEDVAADFSLLPRLAEVAASFAWTKGYLCAIGALEQLRRFVPSARFVLADGTEVLAVHASAVSDQGEGITPTLTAATAAELFPDEEAHIVFGGHTHQQTDVVCGRTRYVNPGSVSNHHRIDRGAQYAILRAEPHGHAIELHDVEYQKQDVIEAIRISEIPGADFLLRKYFGQ